MKIRLEDHNDEKLMAAYASGAAAAFPILFDRYRIKLFTYLVRMTGSHSVAEDLFQEVFFRLIRSRGSYRQDGPFKSYLFTIARHAVIDHRRKRTADPELAPRELEELQEPGSGPVQSASRADLHQRIRSALDELSPEQREVFLLREDAGLDYESIAAVVGTGCATAKSRMRYALSRLRGLLAREWVPDEGTRS